MEGKIIIGATDIIDLPSLKLKRIKCKIDTGADNSAIHAYKIEEIERENRKLLTFKVLDSEHPLYAKKKFIFRNFTKTIIRNSFGDEEERYVVKIRIKLFGKIYKTDFTLANRMEMRFPILLGKKFLENQFLVDVSQKNISYQLKKKSKIAKT
ncbi:hypothetical protein AD998_08335 [bacterium 336/3]|jgi:hypothetical protein|nr:hypothetical protein AD998_08335 [bacterium 336/3]